MIMKDQFMVIKLVELRKKILELHDLRKYDEIIKKISNENVIETHIGKFIFYIDINKMNKGYSISPYLFNIDRTIPLIEHVEHDGEICWRKGNRFEYSNENLFKVILKILDILDEITTSVNYSNIVSEFNLYLENLFSDKLEIQKNKLIWVINPEYSETNYIDIDKNIVFLNIDKKSSFKDAYCNKFKTDLSSVRKKVIKNIIISVFEFINDRNLVNVLEKKVDFFKDGEYYLIWIETDDKSIKYPIISKYDNGEFIFYEQIVINRNFNLKKLNHIIKKNIIL